MAGEIIVVGGKRKRAIAKAKIQAGKGDVFYNGLPHGKLQIFHKLAISEPLLIGKEILGDLKYDIHVKTSGGGKEGQVQAARLAIAKALVAASKSEKLKKAYVSYDRHLIVADTRQKEQYKPGDSKARAKRQKSYR